MSVQATPQKETAMKITRTSDWRDGIEYETPVVVADLVPGDPTLCAICGRDSDLRPRTELWAIKHHHPHNHAGYVQFYCAEHLPVFTTPEAPVAKKAAVRRPRAAGSASRERTTATRRPAPTLDAPRAMCPDCYIEVSAKGLCGVCGETIAV